MLSSEKTCIIQDCKGRYFSCGFCGKHYHRNRNYGDPLKLKRVIDQRGKHPLAPTFYGMRQRCSNPNNNRYKNYGGRGIKVCEEWASGSDGFTNFLRDMGPKPSPEHSLDRIDNNGDYEPSNCRWATSQEQNSNTRATVRVVLDEVEVLSLRSACEKVGLKYGTGWWRFSHGNPIHERIKLLG